MTKLGNFIITFSFLTTFVSAKVISDLDTNSNGINNAFLDYTNEGVENYTLANHPHTFLTTLEIISLHGYIAQSYEVKTEDGYCLQLHRIVGKRGESGKKEKPAVLLMHGILASSSDWVMAGPEKGLGFILSDAGYDVWMGNARGNIYSRKHSSFSVRSWRFWNFSWHEIGYYDLPAKIDFVLKTTRQSKLSYVGHSQGTTTFYVMTSERTEYNTKIERMFSFAPVSYSGNLISPVIKFLAKYVNNLRWIVRLLGIYEVKPTTLLLKTIATFLCREESQLHTTCLNFVFMICGYDHAQMNTTLLPAILSHMPAGASIKQFIHFGQLVNSGRFRQYDYGYIGNKLKYGTAVPPEYRLNQVTTPVFLFYSINDWLSHSQDVEKLHYSLGNSSGMFQVNFTLFNHLDYLYGISAKGLLYKHVMKYM